jgi:hypothetical protein
MNRRVRTGLAVAAVVGLAVGLAPSAAADDDGNRQHYQGAPTEATIGAPFCDAAGHCLVPFQFRNTYVGDVVGTEVSAGQIVATGPLDGPGSSMSVLTATVAGCPGVGSVSLRWTVQFGFTTEGRNTGTYEVVPGSGTGGLATIRGGGSFVTTVQPDGSVTSEFTAKFRCQG